MASQRKRRNLQLRANSEDVFSFISQKTSVTKKKRTEDCASNDILEDSSLFGELISASGFILKKGDQPNLLKCDQAVFQRNFKKSLKIHPRYQPDVIVSEFIEALEKHIEDTIKLKWALLYTQTSAECTNARGGQQDSLIRLLLNIDELQPKLVTLLTENLLVIAHDEEAGPNQADIPRLILANLRWLDHIIEPETLASKVSDLLQGCPLEIQKEVISFAPNIVDDQNHSKIAAELTDLYDSKPELTSAILDTLPCLTLQPESLRDIHHSVLKTLQAVHPHNLPIVVKFLLHNTSQNVAPQVLSDIRENVHLPGDSRSSRLIGSQIASSSRRKNSNEKEYADLEVLLFTNIKMSILTHKYLCTAWLKAINEVEDPKEIRTFDLLMLILLYEIVPSRRKTIESILRNKIRAGIPVDSLLQPAFENHTHVLKEYFESVKRLAAILFRSSEPGFCNYGAALYRFCFVCTDGYHRQEVVLSLLAHLGDQENVRMASLCLMSQLAQEHTSFMVKYTSFLKGALDLVDMLTLREAKKLMDSIIHLAHSERDQSGFRDELSILICKQLSHTDLKYKRLGVLSAVLTLKYSLGEKVNLQGPLKEAEDLFDMVQSSTVNSPCSSALFMDELASNILRNGLNTKLEKWISKKIGLVFQNTFLTSRDESESDCSYLLPISVQYRLDDDAESEDSVFLLLASKVFTSNTEKNSSMNAVITLTPHFRLLRMVESHLHGGDLSGIEALLECGVQMPDASVYEKFTSLSDCEKTSALTCLFYLINWFRELVNAFVTQKDAPVKAKVIARLNEIIKLQNLLAKLLFTHSDYTPPSAVFDFDQTAAGAVITNPSAGNTSKKGKKIPLKKGVKRKKGSDPETTVMDDMSQAVSQAQTQGTATDNQQANEIANLKNYRAYFREFHLDVFNLLFRTLCLDTDLEESSGLTLSQIEFLLTDFNQKLSRVFEGGTKRISVLGKSAAERDVGFSHLDLFTPAEIASEVYRYIKPICFHLETISAFFQSLISDNDGIEDAPSMYTEKTKPIMTVYSMLFTTLKIILSWPGLQIPEHSRVLTLALQMIAKKIEGGTVSQMNKDELIQSSFRYVSKFSSSVVSLSTAVVLVQVLEAIISISGDSEQLKTQIVEIIEKLLKKEWFTLGGNRDKGSSFSHNLTMLLQALFRHTSNSVDCIHTIASTGVQSLLESGGKDPASEIYPTLSKATLHVYYRCLLENLVLGTRKRLSEVTGSQASNRKLETWNVAITSFHILVEVLKSFSTSVMLALCLKNSKGFLELFLRQGMPLMDKCFLTEQQEVLTLIRNMQISTRFLQHLCTHSKLKQDTRMMQYVPLVKRSLEGIVFRVKAMLALNQCSGAFWLGDLKNKDLQGNELCTQIEPESEEDAEEEEVMENEQSDIDLEDEDSNESKRKKDSGDDNSTEYSASF